MTLEQVLLGLTSLLCVSVLGAVAYCGWKIRGLLDESRALKDSAEARKESDATLDDIRKIPRFDRTIGDEFLRK